MDERESGQGFISTQTNRIKTRALKDSTRLDSTRKEKRVVKLKMKHKAKGDLKSYLRMWLFTKFERGTEQRPHFTKANPAKNIF